MQLSFAVVALAVAATASAAVIRPRTTYACIPESEATVQLEFTSEGKPNATCDAFLRGCGSLYPDQDHTTKSSCERLEGYQVFIEALCLIDFGDDKISHTRELAKNLKLRELYPAVGDCYRIKPDTCAKSNYTGNPEHICPAPATPTPVDGGNHDEQCIAEPHATDRFFVANPGADDEQAACDGFNSSCLGYKGNGSTAITDFCEFSEPGLVRATCIGDFDRGQKVSYTRTVAHSLGLGLSIDANGQCIQSDRAPGKCSKRDFDPKVRHLCSNSTHTSTS